MMKPMNNSVTYFFGFSNGFSNQSGAMEISRHSLVLILEDPWIYSWNLTTHLIFGLWKQQTLTSATSHLWKYLRNPVTTV
jgi:hypothetical protein